MTRNNNTYKKYPGDGIDERASIERETDKNTGQAIKCQRNNRPL